MKQSNFLSINWTDVGKGLIVAAITAGLTSISQIIESGALPTTAQLKTAGIMAVTAGISYLIKNYFTPATPADKKVEP